MADIEMKVVGGLVRDPELRFTAGGKAVCELVVIVKNIGKRDGQFVEVGPATFMDITCWDQMAENAAASFVKGDRVMAWGRIKSEEWEDRKTGGKRSKMVLNADEIGASVRWNRCELTRNAREQPVNDSAQFSEEEIV